MSKSALRNLLLFGLTTFVVVVGVFAVLAVTQAQTSALGLNEQIQNEIGLPATDLRIIIARIIRTVLSVLGTIALLVVLYAGFTWMTAAGNEEKIATAKKMLINGGIGLAIILSSYAITSFVISRLVDAINPSGGGGGSSAPGGTFGASNYFYILSRPADGEVCIRNVHPVITFNRPVDVDTLSGRIVVKRDSNQQIMNGNWQQQPNNPSKAVFTPTIPNNCPAPDNGSDCLDANTDFTLEIVDPNNIKAGDGSGLTLNCAFGARCPAVHFKTGNGVDRVAPTIQILSPTAADSIGAGEVKTAQLRYIDDNGIQNISLAENGRIIQSESLAGCQKSGDLPLPWVTSQNPGTFKLQATAEDWAGAVGTDEETITTLPLHCVNNKQDENETGLDCGGSCRACSGTKCTRNDQCASGWCEIPSGQQEGVCVDRMKITQVEPLSGAPGTYVTISGQFFGSSVGRVYFASTTNPGPGDWRQAALACGGSAWGRSEIIVEVPQGARGRGPIRVETVTTTVNGAPRSFVDITTNDGWGFQGDFEVTTQVRPGLCRIVPRTGISGQSVQLEGKNLGLGTSNSSVLFGVSRAVTTNWSNQAITANVPLLEAGVVGVKVASNGIESNGIRFEVERGVAADAPVISEITPTRGAAGEYITITGKNFGKKRGTVWFREVGVSNATAIDGTFDFPRECEAVVWRADQVIVKFPKSGGSVGKRYYVQIRNIDDPNNPKTSQPDANIVFTYQGGNPAPGICNLSPVSGPVPFAATANPMRIAGEYFFTSPLTGPFLRYSFDSGTINGITVSDQSGNNRNGTLTNNVTVTSQGKIGEALEFDGTTAYVDVGSFANPTEQTLVAWIKPAVNQRNPIIDDFQHGIEHQSDGSVRIWIRDDTGNWPEAVSSRYPVNTWMHVVGVYKADEYLKIYVNGKLERTVTLATHIDTNYGSPTLRRLLIGKTNHVGGVWFKGSIDEPQIYNRTLSDSEITALSNGQSISAPAPANAYFAAPGFSPTFITGRLAASSTTLSTSTENGADIIKVKPPNGTINGPVVVYRIKDQKLSNSINFTVQNCVQNNNTCTVAGFQCCQSGSEAGFCKPDSQVCDGELRSAGYVWRFTTRELPPVPRVIERCNDATDRGENLPTPSPSTQWGSDHNKVCRGAVVTAEFSVPLSQASINSGSVVVRKCPGGVSNNECLGTRSEDVVTLTGDSYTLKTAAAQANGQQEYLELQPTSRQWDSNHWYQVVLTKNIVTTSSVSLLPTKPCDYRDSAYCFFFKTGDQECKLSKVIVTPYQYWTQVLEEPIRYRPLGGPVSDLHYRGNGLSDQHCIMMDVSGFNWQWSSTNTQYADIYGTNAARLAQATAKANTVGVGLTNPTDAVNISATASTGTLSKTGHSPLTIDLTKPEVVQRWPDCLEACTNAEVAVRFNTTMSNENVPGAAVNGSVQLLKCHDENCLSTEPVTSSRSVALDPTSQFTVLKIANAGGNTELEPNTLYQVILSATSSNPSAQLWSAARFRDPSRKSKPFNQIYTWRFRTKAEKCLIDRAEMLPQDYRATAIGEKAIYQVQPFSKPDNCSVTGQKLNPWDVNWNWSSNPTAVASLSTFETKGKNTWCTDRCTLKGSDVPYNASVLYPICGNGKVEAGEDCDVGITTNGCSLNCLFTGNTRASCGDGVVSSTLGEACDPADPQTKVGCSNTCRRLGSATNPSGSDVTASVCGNGLWGSGEACDIGITASATNTRSAFGCTDTCLHRGTRISTEWCFDNRQNFGGYTQEAYQAACKVAYSQCGDGVTGPDEDAGCETGNGTIASFCNESCLRNDKNHADPGCTPGKEGCGADGQNLGSSLLYSRPSMCGDGIVGIGEDGFCDNTNNFLITRAANLIDPWALAKAEGRGTPTGTPARQQAAITAATNQQTSGGTIRGSGTFTLLCGFKSDADCKQVYGSDDYGVDANSCCVMRPKLTRTLPADQASQVCRNTTLEVVFDQPINPTTLPNNFIIAKEVIGSFASPEPRHVAALAYNAADASPVYLEGANAVWVDGNYAYVTANGTRQSTVLAIVDVSSSTKPVVKKYVRNALPSPVGVEVAPGKLAYVASRGHAVKVVDVSDPALAEVIASIPEPAGSDAELNNAQTAALSGDYLYVASPFSKTLKAIKVTDPKNVEMKGVVKDTGDAAGAQLANPLAITISGNYAYVAAEDSNALEIIDISQKDAPRHVKAVKDGDGGARLRGASGVAIAGNLAYVAAAGSNALQIIDVKDPANPRPVSSLVDGAGGAQLQGARAVAVSGNFAYVAAAGSDAIEVVDVSDPANPTHVTALKDSGTPGRGAQLKSPRALAISGNYLYVASHGSNALEILDISEFNELVECVGTSDVTSLLASDVSAPSSSSASWHKRLFARVAGFFRDLVSDEAAAVVGNSKWCAGADIGTVEVLRSPATSTSRVVLTLSRPLAASSRYAIILKDGIKDTRGVSIGANQGKVRRVQFTTGADICTIDSVRLQPPDVYFSRANATTTLEAQALSRGGRLIQPIKGHYDWNYLWTPSGNRIVAIQNTTSSRNIITAQNRNGEVDITAAVNIVDNKYSTAKGVVATARAHAIVFLCENPWPPKDYYRKDGTGPFTIFPYEDKAGNNDGYNLGLQEFDNSSIPEPTIVNDGFFNFSAYYCADNGGFGAVDDLPYLRPAVQVANNIVSPSSSLKRFIFTNDKNGDAIGVQIFPNPRHLTVEEWYRTNQAEGGQGFRGNVQNIAEGINGYGAITDGNNVYIDAVNYSANTLSLDTYIYLFSVNSDAKPETRSVFEQLLDNLRFNSNLTNYGYCGRDVLTPGTTTTCKNDFECAGGEVCAVQTDKLKRNYRRLRDLQRVQTNLDKYARENGRFPDLTSGTYIAGQTLSVWPSWSELGNAVGQAFPEDPINQLGVAGTCASTTNHFCTSDRDCTFVSGGSTTTEKCVLHNPTTGWSAENRRFSFACATSSYAYRYFASTSTGYRVRSHFESPGLRLQNPNDFIDDFVDIARYFTNGICERDQEISTLNQGRCGDGQINWNRGEQCDPPGFKLTDTTTCQANPSGNGTVTTCNANCTWDPPTRIACIDQSKCGNRRLDPGEACDDGALNGTYNHCSNTCGGKVAGYNPQNPSASPGFCGDGFKNSRHELCEIAALRDPATRSVYPGWCVAGKKYGAPCGVDADCESILSDACRSIRLSQVHYALSAQDSCNFDCQSRGPYCGDGILQKEFGEECEKSETCSNGAGTRYCSPFCRVIDFDTVGWWKMDDRHPQNNEVPDASSYANHGATCEQGTRCPTIDRQGKVNAAYDFDARYTTWVNIPHQPHLVPTSSFSVEAWIKPSRLTPWMRVLEKGGYTVGNGYTLQIAPSGEPQLVLWNNANQDDSQMVGATTKVQVGQWTHIVGTFEPVGGENIIRIYIDGKFENENYTGDTKLLVGATNDPLMIGRRGAAPTDYFNGLIDEVKLYRRALSAAEVKDHFENGWVCKVAPAVSVANPVASACGDAKVDPSTEACDEGSKNGQACNPAYGKSCSYCASDCRNVVFIEPKEFCGDGKIQANEVCDTNTTTPKIFAAATSTETSATKDGNNNGYEVLTCSDPTIQEANSLKKGTKVCANNCSAILVKETNSTACVKCGIDTKNGVKVKGSVINVLNPIDSSHPASLDPLYASANDIFGTGLLLSLWPSIPIIASTTIVTPQYEFQYQPPGSPVITALINSSPLCYQGDTPNYAVLLSNGNTVRRQSPNNFEVLGEGAEAWRHDLIVSPIMSKNGLTRQVNGAEANLQNSATLNTIRVVVSWTNDSDFYSGFVKPDPNSPPTLEGNGGITPTRRFDYYLQPFDNPSWSVWYHGSGATVGKTHVESFTIDTARMNSSPYFFYVRTRGTTFPMSRFGASARLRVDVYYPEDNGDPMPYNTFSTPTRTFYLNRVEPSANGQAHYWHAFTINNAAFNPDITKRITEAAYIDPSTRQVTTYAHGKIVTDVNQMR